MANENMQTDDERFPMPEQDGWNGALLQQEEQNRVMEEQRRNAAMAEQIFANRSVLDGYRQLGGMIASRKKQIVGNVNANVLSAFSMAANNGGDVPQYMWDGIGRSFCLDRKNAAMVGGKINGDGSLSLLFATRKNMERAQAFRNAGREIPKHLLPQEVKYGLDDLYKIGLGTPGILSRDDMRAMRNRIMLDKKMLPNQLPDVPEDYGEVRGNVGVGNRTASGGTSVNPNWLYGPQRRSNISAFGANGRGGFTNYESSEQTGHQLQVTDAGTRAAEDKGRWKVLSRGADPNSDDGTQITRYENDKTGEVVSVRDGETPPWESRAGGERERIARMNNETRERVQRQRGAAQRDVAQFAADATKHKADASVEVAAQNGRAKTARGNGRSNADPTASLRKILDKSSGATDDERRAAIKGLQAHSDAQAMSDKDRALKKADDIIDLYGGDMSGFPIKDKEQIRKVVAGELYAGREYDPDEWSSYFDDLRVQRAKNAQGAKTTGKAEVKPGDNGRGNGKQFKEGDVQEINGIRMKLLPSKKNPGKLTWQRV